MHWESVCVVCSCGCLSGSVCERVHSVCMCVFERAHTSVSLARALSSCSESLVAKDEESVLEALLLWMSLGAAAPTSLRCEKVARYKHTFKHTHKDTSA
jgi:hypothetical protein